MGKDYLKMVSYTPQWLAAGALPGAMIITMLVRARALYFLFYLAIAFAGAGFFHIHGTSDGQGTYFQYCYRVSSTFFYY